MNKLLLTLVLSCLLSITVFAQEDFRNNPPEPGPAPQIELGDYEQFTLDNGLQVIVVENHKIPRVSFQVFVDVPLHREEAYAGVSSMAGQLLRTGTSSRSKGDIDEAVDFIGASFNTSSRGMFGASLTKHQDALLDIMTDVLYNPSFPEDELEKLKKQTISNLASQKDSPEAIASNVSQVLRYGKDHPYGELTTEETVGQIDLDKCKNYYETYFKPNISYLVIVGDINMQEAKTVAEKHFGKWERGEVEKTGFDMPEAPAETQVAFIDKTGAVQSTINVTYPLQLRPGTQESITARVLNGVLGSSGTSRLFTNLREDKGFTYGAYSEIEDDPYVGYFSASADVRNEVTDSAITEFLYEMERIRKEPVSEEEIESVKAKTAGAFARGLESPQTIARYALNTARYDMPKDFYQNYLKKLSAVDGKAVAEAAQRYVKPEAAHIVVVGNKDEVAGELTSFDANEEVTYYDMYGNVIEAGESMPVNTSAEEVINAYLQAIGTREKLAQVKDFEMTMTTSVQGMQMEMTRKQKRPNKFSMSVEVNGMVMQEQRFDGEEGVMVAQGQKQQMEGKQLEAMATQAIPFPEAEYLEKGFQVEMKGVEKVNGSDAYKILVTQPGGDKVTEFYDAETNFKVRTVQTQDGPNGQMTITNDLSDYKEVAGIMWPHTLTTSGLMPMPLKLEVTTIEVNKGIDDTEFEVE